MDGSHYQPEAERRGEALCLSGGGFRAALFHLGALRRLNEVGLLSTLDTISSVSGGSIAAGLLAAVWPRANADTGRTVLVKGAHGVFRNFPEAYEAPLRAFCSRNIRTAPLLWDRLDPRNWSTLASDDHSATDFLAQAYRDHLVGDLHLGDLAAIAGPKDGRTGPLFVFDASNLQTGVNFTFSGDGAGDYQIGFAPTPDLLVADAIAASSSFPQAFPPLVVKFEPGTFRGGLLEHADPVRPDLGDLRRRVVLSDGGVYDNLGLEPIWKHHALVLCSDGGKPFAIDHDPGQSFVSRLLRAQEVVGNQALAVRKRWLIASLEHRVYHGTYWGIGTEIEGYKTHGRGYSGIALDRIRLVRTDLDTFSEQEQLILMNHGWALTDAALRTYLADRFPTGMPSGAIPSEALLDPVAAVEALKESDHLNWLGR